MPFLEALSQKQRFAGIPFNFKDYLELVDWTGRAVHADKKGFIPARTPKILSSLGLGLSDSEWKVLALDIQKSSITLLHGLEKVALLKRRGAIRHAA